MVIYNQSTPGALTRPPCAYEGEKFSSCQPVEIFSYNYAVFLFMLFNNSRIIYRIYYKTEIQTVAQSSVVQAAYFYRPVSLFC